MGMLLLLAALVGVGIFVVGFGVGRARASEYDRIKKAEYREMSRDLTAAQKVSARNATEAMQYESALRAISQGRGGAPEITAAAALNVVNELKELK